MCENGIRRGSGGEDCVLWDSGEHDIVSDRASPSEHGHRRRERECVVGNCFLASSAWGFPRRFSSRPLPHYHTRFPHLHPGHSLTPPLHFLFFLFIKTISEIITLLNLQALTVTPGQTNYNKTTY